MEKCLVIGAAMLDIVMQIGSLPKKGEDIYADSQNMAVGGCAYNVADIIKHFNVPYTLFAPIGTGMYADFISKKLKEAGHESPIHSEKCDNGYCLCLVEADGERTFITLPGIECSFEKDWFKNINVNEYSCVYVSGYEIEGNGGEYIIEFLEENPQLTVYYAPGPRITYISKEKHNRIFNLKPILHLNEKEAIDFTQKNSEQEAAKWLFEQTKNSVIVTLGSEGVYIYNEEQALKVPAEKVNAIDTIGAGDSHIGGIMAIMAKGSDIVTAIKTANKVSAKVVSVEGPSISKNDFESLNLDV